MSCRVNVWLVERQGNIMSMSLTIWSVVKMPPAVMNVLGVPQEVGRSNVVASSHEIILLSMQHQSSSALYATLCCSLLRKVGIEIGCKLSFLEDLAMTCVCSPHDLTLPFTDLTSDLMSSNMTMVGSCLDCTSSCSMLFTLPLLLLLQVNEALDAMGMSLEVVG